MRELKFRAWHEADKCWYNPRFIEMNLLGQAILSHGIEQFEIIPASVIEQYTGLKDNNGKEIYEGDIVRCYSRKRLLGEYQVIWNEDCGGFECESLKPLVDGGDRMLKDVRVFNEISIQFRVIGNIHENPELLD